MVDAKKEKGPKILLGMFDIIPADEDVNIDAMMAKIKEVILPLKAELMDFKMEEVAYGIKKVVARLAFPDTIVGGTEPIEAEIMKLESLVQRAECTMTTIYR